MPERDCKAAGTAVIIPQYNGLHFLKDCLEALSHQSYTDFRVIVVDNGSTDGSAEYLRSRLDVESIFLDQNYGFSAAINRGIEAAGDAEFVVLLNNDTVPERDFLSELLRPFDEDANACIAAVSPLMLQLSDPARIDDAGDGYNILGWGFQRGVGQKALSRRFQKECRVSSACAGASAYRKAALQSIAMPGGIFDEGHFAYLEDIDISIRLRLSGYYLLYEPQARVAHFGSGTSGSRYNDFKVRLAARNNIYLIYKNFPLLMILINLPFLALGTLIKAAFFVRRGFGRAYVDGLREGLKGAGSLRARKLRFAAPRLHRYIALELGLIRDTFSYTYDFLLRKLGD